MFPYSPQIDSSSRQDSNISHLMQKDTTMTKIFVGGLPYHTTDDSLREYFEKFGEIEEAVVITDRQTGKSKGYGFVTMNDKAAADIACRDPNPIIDGRKANVNLAYIGAKPRTIQTTLPFPAQIPYSSLKPGMLPTPPQYQYLYAPTQYMANQGLGLYPAGAGAHLLPANNGLSSMIPNVSAQNVTPGFATLDGNVATASHSPTQIFHYPSSTPGGQLPPGYEAYLYAAGAGMGANTLAGYSIASPQTIAAAQLQARQVPERM